MISWFKTISKYLTRLCSADVAIRTASALEMANARIRNFRDDKHFPRSVIWSTVKEHNLLGYKTKDGYHLLSKAL